tara:strand:+ start:86 stop:316 length:231 start_codon:yes stop_codon:yes gene_type:complete
MPPQNTFNGNKLEDYHYIYLERMIKWYVGRQGHDGNIHKMKIDWLSDMMQKQFYDEKEKLFLNKMVNQYNNKGEFN